MIPRELLNKYNQAIPRYTSYPPANYFTTVISSDDCVSMIVDSNKHIPENISLYIHIPFCHKICFYCGCNSVRYPKNDIVDNYIEALVKEIKLVRGLLDQSRKVSQLHYGGGTPNAIPVEYIERINNVIFEEFTFINNPEIAIECHPAHLTEEYITRLVKAGFNRFSLGIQDFNNEVLETVNREPSKLPIDYITGLLRELSPEIKVNFDFIYGLPHQTPDSFVSTLNEALRHNPDRIVTFSYAHVPWFKKYQVALEKAGLPDAESKIRIFEKSFEILKENGYSDIGMDHYAKGDDELILALKNNELHRNFQGYCTKRTTGQVYAFGVSSISQLFNSYYQNTKGINEYIEKLSNGVLPVEKGYYLNEKEIIVREVINHLMCNRFMSWSDIASRFSLSISELQEIVSYNKAKFDNFIIDDLINLTDEEITITAKGRFFIRNIAAALDPAMAIPTDKKFSKSI